MLSEQLSNILIRSQIAANSVTVHRCSDVRSKHIVPG